MTAMLEAPLEASLPLHPVFSFFSQGDLNPECKVAIRKYMLVRNIFEYGFGRYSVFNLLVLKT